MTLQKRNHTFFKNGPKIFHGCYLTRFWCLGAGSFLGTHLWWQLPLFSRHKIMVMFQRFNVFQTPRSQGPWPPFPSPIPLLWDILREEAYGECELYGGHIAQVGLFSKDKHYYNDFFLPDRHHRRKLLLAGIQNKTGESGNHVLEISFLLHLYLPLGITWWLLLAQCKRYSNWR